MISFIASGSLASMAAGIGVSMVPGHTALMRLPPRDQPSRARREGTTLRRAGATAHPTTPPPSTAMSTWNHPDRESSSGAGLITGPTGLVVGH